MLISGSSALEPTSQGSNLALGQQTLTLNLITICSKITWMPRALSSPFEIYISLSGSTIPVLYLTMNEKVDATLPI